MPFDVNKAIDNAILVIRNLEDFYRNYTKKESAQIKIEDGFFIVVRDGLLGLEYNNEGYNNKPYQPIIDLPDYNPIGDHTFVELICNIRNCRLDEEQIRKQIELFLYNIPIIGK